MKFRLSDGDQQNVTTEIVVAGGQGSPRAFRSVVDDLTIAALREYDDGPLTPPRQQPSAQDINCTLTNLFKITVLINSG